MQKQARKLSILHINTNDSQGGAAKSTWRLTQAQIDAQHDAKRLVGYKHTPSPTSFHFPIELDPFLQIQCVQQGLQYYQFQGSHRLFNNELVKNADILHFQNLHGDYFNPFSISVLSQMKPVVWTLRDMHAVTGHCGYSLDCEKWRTGCGECPYLNNYPEIITDATAQLWQDKKLIYAHSSLQIVTPSQWLKNIVEDSILKNHPVELIYNGTNTDIFYPYQKSEVRKKFNIPDNVPVIGAVAQGSTLGNPYKGGQYTLAALEKLRSLIPDFVFVNVGADYPSDDKYILNFPYITDETELAQIYSALDFFLFTTLADNCPLVVIEAMACGVPLVTFATGGVPELVRDGQDGLVTPYRDVDAIVDAAKRLATDDDLRQRLSQNARQRAVTHYDMKTVASNYEQLYLRRIEKFHASQADRMRQFTLSMVHPIIRTPAFLAAEQAKIQFSNASDIQKKPASVKKQNLDMTDVQLPEKKVRQTEGVSAATFNRHPSLYLVTAIVSTFNSEFFLRGCLDDLLNQTIADKIEIVVIDSGSSQNEKQIIDEYCKRHDNIVYIRTDYRESIYAAWNRGIKSAHGKYLTNANTDDRHRADALEIMSNMLEENPNISLVYADQIYTSIPNETYETTNSNIRRTWSEYSYQTLRSHCMVGPQPMWRMSLHEKYGLFDGSFFSAGDWEFWLRIGEKEVFKKIDQVLGLYYVNPRGLENVHPATVSEVDRIRQKYQIMPHERGEPSFTIYNRQKVHTVKKIPEDRKKLILLMQIDGMRFKDLSKTTYLKKIIENGFTAPLKPALNMVCRPALFGGLRAAEYGYSNRFHFDAVSSPFGITASLPRTVGLSSSMLETKERTFISSFVTGERITPYASAVFSEYEIPPEYLPFINISEKRSPWDKDPGYHSLFNELKRQSIPWYQCSKPDSLKLPDNSDAGIIRHVLDNLPPSTHFAYVQLDEIIDTALRHSPESTEYGNVIRQTDRLIEQFVESLNLRFSQIEMIIFSKHVTSQVKQQVDIWAMINRSSIKFGNDFLFFLEPNLAFFSFYTRHARSMISKNLSRLKNGKILNNKQIDELGLSERNHRNGELVYLTDPGTMIFPNFINRKEPIPKGVITSNLESPENQGLFILHSKDFQPQDADYLSNPDVLSIHHLLLELMNIHSGD